MNKLYIANEKNKDFIYLKNKKGLIERIAKSIYINKKDIPNINKIILDEIIQVFQALKISGNICYSSALNIRNPKENIFYISGNRHYEIELKYFGKIKIYKSSIKESNPLHTISLSETNLTISIPERAIIENYSLRKVDENKIDKEEAKKHLKKMVEFCQNNKDKLQELKNKFIQISKDLLMEREGELIQKDIFVYEKEFSDNFDGYLYDVNRIDKLNNLKIALKDKEFNAPLINYSNEKIVNNLSFFESYFSNYIEGTRFEINEAVDIMINKKTYERHQDGHDILSHRELTLEKESSFNFSSEDLFLDSLKTVHKKLMKHRDEYAGEFKTRNNQAGNRNFVNVELVEGSLRHLYRLTRELNPISKALVLTIGFLEIHPFSDGNGRIGRLLMNSILQSNGYGRIIIPTVLREDYILGLKSFTLNSNYEAYIRLFDKIFKINSEINYNKEIEEIIEFFEEKNAFSEKGIWGEIYIEEKPLFL